MENNVNGHLSCRSKRFACQRAATMLADVDTGITYQQCLTPAIQQHDAAARERLRPVAKRTGISEDAMFTLYINLKTSITAGPHNLATLPTHWENAPVIEYSSSNRMRDFAILGAAIGLLSVHVDQPKIALEGTRLEAVIEKLDSLQPFLPWQMQVVRGFYDGLIVSLTGRAKFTASDDFERVGGTLTETEKSELQLGYDAGFDVGQCISS
jgi:hypothetical protein